MTKMIFGTIGDVELYHFGTPRHSGRYPWGSGENPYHHGRDGIHTVTQNRDSDLLNSKLKRKQTKESITKDIAACNPKLDPDKFNGYNTNCSSAAMAYDMRRRGYDVTAKRSRYRNDKNPDKFLSKTKGDVLAQCYSGAVKHSIHFNEGDTIEQRVSKFKKYGSDMPDNARGLISIRWDFGGGHTMVWEKQNGKLITRDPQANRVNEGMKAYKSMCKYAKITTPDDEVASVELIRTDNLQPTNEILKYVENRKG